MTRPLSTRFPGPRRYRRPAVRTRPWRVRSDLLAAATVPAFALAV